MLAISYLPFLDFITPKCITNIKRVIGGTRELNKSVLSNSWILIMCTDLLKLKEKSQNKQFYYIILYLFLLSSLRG